MIVLAAATATTITLAAKKPAWIVLLMAGLVTVAVREDAPDLFGYEALNVENTTWSWLLIAAGLAGWALRNRSWRVGVVVVAYTIAAFTVSALLALIPLAAAACAGGPRRSLLYAGGVAVVLVPIITLLTNGSSVDQVWLWLVAAVGGILILIGVFR